MLRWIGLAALALSLAAGGAAAQQETDSVSRPTFLAAMGLLDSERVTVDEALVGKPVEAAFSVSLPTSQQIDVVAKTDMPGALFGVDFGTKAGIFAESIAFTPARIDFGPPEQRAFAMANLLVLRAFASLKDSWPDAQMLGFAPIEIGGMPAVHLYGTFTGPSETQLVFRHVGFLPEDREETIVALATISPAIIPVTNNASLDDTFSGWTLDSLAFLPVE